MAKWAPQGTRQEILDRFLLARGMGKTWRAIATKEGVSRSTFYEWVDEYPDIKAEVDKREDAEQQENIRQTLLEIALVKKNVVALIFLAKAKCNLFDVPNRAVEPAVQGEVLYPPMTKEQWREVSEERQKAKAK